MRATLTLGMIVWMTSPVSATDYVQLHSFYDTTINEHVYTIVESEVNALRKKENMKEDPVLGWVPKEKMEGTTRLYRVFGSNRRHYFYTVKPPGLKNFKIEDPPMYVLEKSGTGRIAIHATCLSGGEDMVFSASKDVIKEWVESTKKGIGNERKVFYKAFYVFEKDPNAQENKE